MVGKLTQNVVKKIFPAGSEIIENFLEVPPKDRFWIIPGQNGPRWLIPQEKKYGLLVFKQWRPYDFVSLIKWKVIYVAYRSGWLSLIPKVKSIGIVQEPGQDWKHFIWDRESPPIPIVYFGTPCSTHKAVAMLVDSDKRQPCTICKVPLADLAEKSLKKEYDTLCHLTQRYQKIAPKPYFIDAETGATVQEALIGTPLPRTFSGLHWGFLEQLTFSNSTTSVLEHSQRLIRLMSKTESLNQRTKIALERLLKECNDDTPIPQILIHGDFTPWNIIKIENGSLIALDWEKGETNGLPFYDFFYFFLVQSYLFHDKFNSNRIFKLLPESKKKYPLTQILKFTAASIGFRLAKEKQNMLHYEDFLKSMK